MLTFEFTGAEGRMTEGQTLTSGMVGKQVKFLFSPEWDNLRKTAVFTAGDVTRDVVDVSGEAVIPARVLEKPLKQLYVGIYGTNAQGDIVIPTVWVPGPMVQPGADPSGDPSTAPELPVWDRILAMIGSLENLETRDRENLVAAINEAARATRELQPDWNQHNVNHADYIKNRTHWMADSRITLSWDGDRAGRRVLYLPARDSWYCRISDQTPEAGELAGGGALFLSGGSAAQEEMTPDTMTLGENAYLAASGGVLVVTGRKFVLGEDAVMAPETGVYAWFDHRSLDSFVARICWGQLRVLRLDDRFMPLTVARKEEVGFTLGSRQAQLLMELLRNASYSADQTAALEELAQGLGVSGGDSQESGIRLTGIAAVYAGGDVPAGTPLSVLSDLQVWAIYSDGSVEPITGYTLSGVILEGSNAVTAIYQGKTAEFTVYGTGVSQTGDAPVGWFVNLTLSGCTADKQNCTVAEGLPLAVGLTADNGHTLEGARVRVTMGGADITADSYMDGLVTIGAVTGDVDIVAEAVAV